MTKIAWRVALLLAALSLLLTAASLAGQEPGTTFAMGKKETKFDLKIDSHALYNGALVPGSTWALKDLKPHVDKFFNLGDVKPGDQGEATISLHATKDAWVCMEFSGLKEKENGENEPESLEDTSGSSSDAELADGTEFFVWHDDGDDVFEVGEKPIFGPAPATDVLKNKTYPIADYKHGSPLVASSTKYVGLQWCAGNMSVTVQTATISCDGEALGNEAQTDSFTVDISFEAVAKKDNPKFTCKKHNHHDDICELGEVDIKVNNSSVIKNTTSSSASTGGNSAGSGGTVTTGNATSSSKTTNIVNQTIINLGNTVKSVRDALRSR